MKSFRLHGDVTTFPMVGRSEYMNCGASVNTPVITAGELEQFFSSEHFLVGIDLEKSDLLSGHSVANQLYLNLNFSAAVGTGVQLYMVMHHDKNVILYPGLQFEERV